VTAPVKKGKGAPKKEVSPPPDEKRCEAKTAKGARCMKCAKEGEVFCSVHLKPAAPKKAEAESSNSRDAQIFHEVNKRAEEPVTSKSLKPARPSKKKKKADDELSPPPPLERAETVRPSWFEEGEAAEDESADPTWTLGEEGEDETQVE
jgi:hypothetical protein